MLQDVFLRVTRNGEALETAREPLACLYTVAKSAMIDHLRRRKHRGVAAEGVPEDIPDPLPDISSGEFATCLVPLVRNLPDIYRDAVTFVDLDGGRQTDLAAARGLSVSTVKSRVQRGRQQLRSAILDCCQVERDALKNITSLAPGARGPDCC
ncbi:sigma factor-like helix-turn-helix DNA-binding protein [Tropicimonas isoalkanivorans]|uniref:RNA polymerase sigma-70 factor, ECF subfamily n=1 Tax=Tropicimonas isoalkanivorans TaxID=441112 RepID=A0A1I1PX95_9RHOB|nr:sigma factor-like helix-turn-helix DNA-binding protein [Tropicimonas isoalkanivorans]SFD14449.1 RNA polymerase sigma-70 factor, ECF subfamily [Tropicimonas isoalkanivorans]